MKKLLQFITWPAVAGVLLAIIILQGPFPFPGEGPDARRQPNSYADAVEVAAASVVNIYTSKIVQSRRHPIFEDPYFRRFMPPPQQRNERVQRSLGSGVIVSADGYILTNEHVIAGADEILVQLNDGRDALASLIGSDPETDLALLHIELQQLSPVQLANSAETRVGDVVLAIGNPYGFGHSVSQGIVSALGRYGLGQSTYEDYIQTDATINPGNSGGALIDLQGKLLGINTLIYTRSGGSMGIGLATPANLALFVMQDLIQFGKVVRGWMGLSVQPLRTAQDNSQVLRVSAIDPAGPAQRGGILINDLITHIDNKRVIDGRLTMHEIALKRPGDVVAVTLVREDRVLQLQIVVGTRPRAEET